MADHGQHNTATPTHAPSDGHPAKPNSSSEQPKVDRQQPNTNTAFTQAERLVRFRFGGPEASPSSTGSSDKNAPSQPQTVVVAETQQTSQGTQTLPSPQISNANDVTTPSQPSNVKEDKTEPNTPTSSSNDQVQPADSTRVDNGRVDPLPTEEVDSDTRNSTGTDVSSSGGPAAPHLSANVPSGVQSTGTKTPTDSASNPATGGTDQDASKQPKADSHKLQSAPAPSGDSGPLGYMVQCPNCLQTKSIEHFHHAKHAKKVVKNCRSCRELDRADQAKVKRAAKQFAQGKDAEAILIDLGVLPENSLTSSGEITVKALAPPKPAPQRDAAKQTKVPQPKETIHNCPKCDKKMPESQFFREGYSMRTCNNCATRKPATVDISVQPIQNGKDTETRDILLDKVKDACSQAAVSQPESQPSSNKRQYPSFDGLSDSMKKLKTNDTTPVNDSANRATPTQVLSQATQIQENSDRPADTAMTLRGGGGGLINIRRLNKQQKRSQRPERKAVGHHRLSALATLYDPTMSISEPIFILGRDYLTGNIPLQILARQRGLTTEELLPEARRSLILYLLEAIPEFGNILARLLKHNLFAKALDGKDITTHAQLLHLFQNEAEAFKQVLHQEDMRRKLVNALEQVRVDQIDDWCNA
ncbi:hypothetical protein PFICI_12778 [Pestalotiopsis fici W106-1]|uniref:Uncharacterized protein n=1 Tax=Pestalotiopsis fici (strain W106-1 / CGMCC3.15140) TaxID=1229662 RepID=W3WPW6_PESFW|nr:uncharacterized protein PFICI_12778 [Pestalotiopsis fici W106-1]ETS75834.1 hypothetical protein PFICI_12778 [Pestalotiopsis fici W106-1]